MKTLSKIFAVIISFMMIFTMMPVLPMSAGTVFAAENIGEITVDGKTTSYTDYRKLKQALEKLKNKEITVEMLTDWDDSRSDMTVGERLKIPEGSATTLNMNGHKFDRNLTKNNKSEDDGEVILIMKGATLTINGGEGNASHDAYVYKSISKDAKPVKENVGKGGLITGGASDDGAGAIHVYDGGNLIMNQVTIAGCRAADRGDGGGIYLENDSHSVELNDSKIIGCFATKDGGGIFGTSSIPVYFSKRYEKKAEIVLNNSHIDNNYAMSDGGGIDMDAENTIITASGDSSVSGNECKERGGGILLYGHYSGVSGITLDNNKADYGGAIACYKGGVSLSDLVMEGNTANTAGGGVYFFFGDNKDRHLVKKYFIPEWNPEDDEDARQKGPDAQPAEVKKFDYYSGNTINNCTIQYNTAKEAGGVGMPTGLKETDNFDSYSTVPVAITWYQTISLKGKTVISDNTATGSGASRALKNVAILDYDGIFDEWEYGRIMTELSEGSKVGISYEDNDRSETITLTPPKMKDKNSEAYLESDQDSWHFVYKDGRTTRVRGYKPDPTPATPVSSSDANNASEKEGNTGIKAGKVGTVSAGGKEGGVGDNSKDYDLIRFFSDHEAHDFICPVYYSDGLFYEDPAKYNEHLATATWALAYAGGYLIKDEEPVNGNKYYNKHAAGRQYLADIGCPDQNIYINNSNASMPWVDSIGVTIGSKELVKADGTKTGDILVPVTVRGLGYDAEWLSNLTLGYAGQMSAKGNEAMGFSGAADQVVAEIEYYLKKYKLEDAYKNGKVIFWVTGYSRAGATANITSKRLVEKIDEEGNSSKVFAYTCEAAKGGTDDAEKLSDKTKYYCIHNMINKADLVPYVGPEEMGFKRYGVDHYIPGSDAGQVKVTPRAVIRGGEGGVTRVTTCVDNTAMRTKGKDRNDAESQAYVERRNQMLKYLKTTDGQMIFDDYFHPMTLDFLDIDIWAFSMETMHQYEYGSYDNNRIEDFVADFIRFAQEGKEPKKLKHWSQAVTSRDGYARDRVVLNDSLNYPAPQDSLKDLMLIVMTMDVKESDRFMKKISTIMDQFDKFNLDGDSLSEIYFNVVGEWYERSSGQKQKWANRIYRKIVATEALEELSPDNKSRFEKNYYTILDLVLHLLDADYNYKPKNNNEKDGQPEWAHGSNGTMMYLPTLLNYLEQIITYHLPQGNIAWAMTYDNWYENELTEYTLTPPASVAPPAASVNAVGKDGNGEQVTVEKSLDPSPKENTLIGDQRVILENEDIAGEAIYYDLIDLTNGGDGETMASNQIYRGGIDLTLGSASEKEYKIETYDMSYGVKSSKSTFLIKLTDAKHNVIVIDKAEDGDEDDDYARTQTLSFDEGAQADVQAGTSPLHYFTNWTVMLLDADGNEVRDVTEELLGTGTESKAESPSIQFEMPESGDDYPSGYQLKLTAGYGERIKSLEVRSTDPGITEKTLIDPASGAPLAKSFAVKFEGSDEWISYPVTWSYVYSEDGEQKTVTLPPSESGYNAYNDTEYTASVTLPQDKTKGIMFFDVVSGDLIIDEDMKSSGTITSQMNRNAADGSVEVKIVFRPTEESGGDDKPQTVETFKVNAIDLNTGEQDPDTEVVAYTTSPNATVTITAPNAPGLKFIRWNLGSSGIELDTDVEGNDLTNKTISVKIPGSLGDDVSIDAEFIPVVTAVEVNLKKGNDTFSPVGGKTDEHDGIEMFVTIQNTYQIDPDNLRLEWDPGTGTDGNFPFMVQNKATVSIVPGADGTVNVRPKGSESDAAYRPINLIVIPAENMQVTFNGNSEALTYVFEEDNYKATKAFPLTKYVLDQVKSPEDINNVDHGQGESDIRDMLPKSTTILTENGLELIAEIEWTSVEQTEGAGDSRNAAVWTAIGKVKLPDSVDNPKKVSLDISMDVGVRDADTALMPDASLDSKTYLYNQSATLNTNEPEGTTYYTLDGSDPTEESPVYNGETIFISRDSANLQDELDDEGNPTGRKMFTIKAFTKASGKWDSDIAVYEYVFDNELPVPEGTNHKYNGENQIGVTGDPFYTLVPISEGVTIDEDGNAVAKEPGTYKVKAVLTYKDSMYWALDPDDPTKNTTEDQIIEFTITEETAPDDPDVDPDAEKFVITFDLNGGTLDGKTGQIKESYNGGSIITMPEPSREGYTFEYWKGSKYEAGQKYKVTEDHLFVAQWKKSETPGNGNEDGSSGENGEGTTVRGTRTGDDSSIFLWFSLMILPMIALASILIYRRKQNE